MIQGRFLSSNVGNFMPTRKAYLYHLSDPALAKLIHNRVVELSPDIYAVQEIWTYLDEVLGTDYEIVGTSDCIAVKKTFGKFVPGTFKSHTLRFKKSAADPPLPDFQDEAAMDAQREQLRKVPYDGSRDSPYGIPADFDISSAIIETHETHERVLIVNAHPTSAPWRDHIRANQFRSWVLDDCLARAKAKCEGRIFIAGDYNHDEIRQPDTETTVAIQELLAQPGMADACGGNYEATTNLPRSVTNYRYDHIIGTAKFQNYRAIYALTDTDFAQFKHQHRMTWWMHLDHKSVVADFMMQ